MYVWLSWEMTLADPDLEPRSSLEQEMGPQSNTMESEVVSTLVCGFVFKIFVFFAASMPRDFEVMVYDTVLVFTKFLFANKS